MPLTQDLKTALNAAGNAPVFACRAWVNFNGSGTVAIRASGNVSSITDNGVGDYTINFAVALPDADYAIHMNASPNYGVNVGPFNEINSTGATLEAAPSASACRVATYGQNTSTFDAKYVNASFFR